MVTNKALVRTHSVVAILEINGEIVLFFDVQFLYYFIEELLSKQFGLSGSNER